MTSPVGCRCTFHDIFLIYHSPWKPDHCTTELLTSFLSGPVRASQSALSFFLTPTADIPLRSFPPRSFSSNARAYDLRLHGCSTELPATFVEPYNRAGSAHTRHHYTTTITTSTTTTESRCCYHCASTTSVSTASPPPPRAAASTTTTDLTSYLVEHVQGCTHARCSVLHIADRFERAETARAHSLTAAASLAPKSAPSHTGTLALLPYSRACIQPHQLADCTKQSISPQRRVRLCGSL